LADAARLLQAFDRQIGWCSQPSPFGARVLTRSRHWLAAHDEALTAVAAVADDPLVGAVALRWLSGLHHLALLGRAPWAGLWSPAGPAADDAALDDAIESAWCTQRAHMQAALAGPPQTNEVQRSAALLPGLLHIAAQTQRPLALAEIGSSAGLNLWCDQHRYRFDAATAEEAWVWGDPAAALGLQCDWTGGRPSLAPLDIRHRAGCDALPVDLLQPGQDLRLASFIWPDQPERLARLRAAVGVARQCMAQQGVRVQRALAADFVRTQLERRPEGVAWVLMHSVVWQYIDAGEQADIQARMQAAGAAATAASPLAWLRFEPPQADLRVELRCRLWPGGQDTLLAVCHPHGNWAQWQTAA
jgi:hypothetical protein